MDQYLYLALIKKTLDPKCWGEHGEKGTLKHGWWACELVQPLWKTAWRSLKKLNYHKIQQPHFWVYSQRKWQQDIKKLSVPPVFVAALLPIASTRQQPKGLSGGRLQMSRSGTAIQRGPVQPGQHMEGPWRYDAKSNTLDRGRQIIACYHFYLESWKKQSQTQRTKEQKRGCQEQGRGSRGVGELVKENALKATWWRRLGI